MLIIVGAIVVMGSVLGGYVLHHGNLAVLWQPTELIIILGAALGSMVIQNPMSVTKAIIKQLIHSLKASEPTKQQFTDLLLCLYELIKTGKGNILGLEAHVENPANSEIFKKYPSVLNNHHCVHFIADTLKVQISSPVSPYDLEDLMNADINAAHTEELKPSASVRTVGDAMPGLGIVAAVLGVVITMGKLTAGKEVIGQSVAAALVGTFIGVLAAYGFFGPVAAKMEANVNQEGQFMHVAKAALLAFAKDCSPKVCVEFARRTIPPEVRPDFHEVDAATSNLKAA